MTLYVVCDSPTLKTPKLVSPEAEGFAPYVACREQALVLVRLLHLDTAERAVYRLDDNCRTATLVYVHTNAAIWPASFKVHYRMQRRIKDATTDEYGRWLIPGDTELQPKCWNQSRWQGVRPELDVDVFIPEEVQLEE